MTKLKDRIVQAINKEVTDFPKREIHHLIFEHFTKIPLLPMEVIFEDCEQFSVRKTSDGIIVPMVWYFEFIKHFTTVAGLMLKRRFSHCTENEKWVTYQLMMPDTID